MMKMYTREGCREFAQNATPSEAKSFIALHVAFQAVALVGVLAIGALAFDNNASAPPQPQKTESPKL